MWLGVLQIATANTAVCFVVLIVDDGDAVVFEKSSVWLPPLALPLIVQLDKIVAVIFTVAEADAACAWPAELANNTVVVIVANNNKIFFT